MSATLGGLIKDYRLQKNISQLEVAFALGWKEPSRLSRIEKGKVEKPPRKLLDGIMDSLNLSDKQRNLLLYSGNYLPTDEELVVLKKRVGALLEKWKYPALLYDYSWRVVHVNKLFDELYHYNKIIPLKKNPNILEILFHPDLKNHRSFGEGQDTYEDFLLWTIIQFKEAQANRSKEHWYTDLVRKMMANPEFKKLWLSADMPHEERLLYFYQSGAEVLKKGKRVQLSFYTFIVPLFRDKRFDLEFHVPADRKTFEYFGE